VELKVSFACFHARGSSRKLVHGCIPVGVVKMPVVLISILNGELLIPSSACLTLGATLAKLESTRIFPSGPSMTTMFPPDRRASEYCRAISRFAAARWPFVFSSARLDRRAQLMGFGLSRCRGLRFGQQSRGSNPRARFHRQAMRPLATFPGASLLSEKLPDSCVSASLKKFHCRA